MADELDETIGSAAGVARAEQRPATISRRVVLRGASVAVPTILTLSGGSAAAAAMTSAALITASAKPEGNNYLCLSQEVFAGTQSGKYVIDPAFVPLQDGDITPIPAGVTFYYEKNGELVATPLDMCDPAVSQTKFWYKDPGWRETADIRKGIAVSCDAMGSFSSSISYCRGDV
jgi:hypothetical protein